MKEWALYSALALLAWGLWAFLPKVALIFLDPKTAFMFEVIGGAITGVLALFILRPQLVGMEVRGIIPALLTGVLGYLGLLCFMFAIREGKVCVVAPLTALYPVITLALAMLFLKEKINVIQFAGIILALISVVLISHE
ncbi:MAG TPA: EamA family transporter [Syntrophobacteraceae bacterium]|nr:EamA family transporter [Syntrophobacteraceae bacterium]